MIRALSSLFVFLLGLHIAGSALAADPCEIIARVKQRFADQTKVDVMLPSGVSTPLVSLGNGRKVPELTMSSAVSARPDFARYVENSVEIVYTDVAPFGHIRLRVGDRILSLNFLMSAKEADFNPEFVRQGSTGFVFGVGAARIKALQQYIERLFVESRQSNLPPFDAYSPLVEVVKQADGSLHFRSDSPDFANNLPVQARVIEEGGKTFLETPSGFRYPAVRQGDKLLVQSLACSTITTYVMQHILDIPMVFDQGAKDILQTMMDGNPGYRSPDAIVRY